jgi:hypothetical protein
MPNPAHPAQPQQRSWLAIPETCPPGEGTIWLLSCPGGMWWAWQAVFAQVILLLPCRCPRWWPGLVAFSGGSEHRCRLGRHVAFRSPSLVL